MDRQSQSTPPDSPRVPGATQEDAREIYLPALSACCVQTIELHAAHNPMMVCPDCKHMIKCFKDDKSLRNYLTFCRSRHRKVAIGQHRGMHVVLFRNYGDFA